VAAGVLGLDEPYVPSHGPWAKRAIGASSVKQQPVYANVGGRVDMDEGRSSLCRRSQA